MATTDDEEERLRAVALRNAQSILLARRRTEEALRKQSEWLRVALASIGDAVISTDVEGRVTFMNGVAEALTGWPQAEAAGRPLPDVFHIINEQTRQPAESPALRAMREGTIVGLANHTVLIARDGTERPIDDSAAPMRDEGGTTLGAILVFRDVTEQRRAAEDRARLAAIVESSEDAIVSKSLDGIIRSWNAGAERLFGYTPAEAVGRPITLVIPPERLEEERTILDRLRRGERVEHFDTVRVAKDGRRLDISLTVSPIHNAEGRVVGASKVARDITARKRAEAANAKFRAFFEQGTNFAGVLALDGTVVEANRLCLDACGFTREEVVGRPFWECGWWNRSAALMDMVRAACARAAGGGQFRTETNYFVAGGAERVVDLILAPVTDEAGRVLFVAATGTDVTERRRMEDALREADRNKDAFLAQLGHELRNSLSPLLNGLQLVRLSGDDRKAREEALDVALRQVRQMKHLTDDLLDVARVRQGKIDLKKEMVDLNAVVAAAVESARPAVEGSGHELEVSLPPGRVPIDADPPRLLQVVVNLLNNACKYTPRRGRIRVAVERGAGEAVVRVKDTGIGLAPEMRERIFDLYAQAADGRRHSQGGLGIGLSLVKCVVELHGGSVSADSAGPGSGSEFVVRLPAREAIPSWGPPTPPAAAPARARSLRVLLVDDNVDSTRTLAQLLRLWGHEVETATDGPSALLVARTFRPEVVLLDVGLPGMDGREVGRRLRGEVGLEQAVMVAVTGFGQEEDSRLSREAGLDFHMVKPVDIDALQDLLARHGAGAGRDAPPPARHESNG